MYRSIYLVAALAVLSTNLAIASEGDPYTQRRQVQTCTPDGVAILDAIVNDRMQRALKEANRKGPCSREQMEKAILRYLGDLRIAGVAVPIGAQELEINRGKAKYLRNGLRKKSIPSVSIKKRDSIYQDLTLRESPGTVISIGALVRMNGLVVSSDKFTHFFEQGHQYLEEYRKTGQVSAGLKLGMGQERGKLGWDGTGVLAYGDLAANYDGFRFWKSLTCPGGHVGRRGGKWIQTRCFHWMDWVTPAWDEGINPGGFKCGAISQKINSRIRGLVRCGRIPHMPPLDTHRVPEIATRYDASILPWILNPKTLAMVYPPTATETHTISDAEGVEVVPMPTEQPVVPQPPAEETFDLQITTSE